MANLCDFEMKIQGDRTDRKAFLGALAQEGEICMGRGAEFDVCDEDEDSVFIVGWCKWSLYAALILNAISMRDNPERWYWGEGGKPEEFITILEASKKWNLMIEAFSWESGVGFSEHMLIQDGEFLENEETEFYVMYIGDFDTKEEAEEELEISITDEEWENQEDVERGGFEANFSF